MAIGDITYVNGLPVRILSSGETPTTNYINGLIVVIHEYIESGGATAVPVFVHHLRQQGVM